MDKKNIILNNLCINGIISVIKSNNMHHHELLTVNGRHSDAFVYVIEGRCSYRFEKGTEFTVNTGDVFLPPSRIGIHDVYTYRGLQIHLLRF